MTLEDSTLQEIRQTVERYTAATSWTDITPAFLGTGETPPVVVVPPTERIAPGAVYVYGAKVENKGITQVLNNHPGMSFSNDWAGIPVRIGRPEGSKDYYIKDILGDGLSYTGGVLPTEYERQEQKIVTPNRLQELVLVEGGGMVLSANPGKYQIDTTIYTVSSAPTKDMTSYIPSTASKEQWNTITIDTSGVLQVTEGSEYTIGTTDTVDMLPTTVTAGQKFLGWVRTYNGQTEITSETDIIPGQLTSYTSSTAGLDHGGLSGLSDDDHSQYALLAGRSGGQEVKGGTDANDDLTLTSTNNATKGNVFVNDSELAIRDEGDESKILQFQASGITTATTRTLTVPDASGTIVLNDNTAILTTKTMSGASNTFSNIGAASIVAGTFGTGAYVIQGATTSVVPLTLKTTDDNTTNPILSVVDSTDNVQVSIGATGGVVINEEGNDIDSRIEGDNDANLTYWDAGNDHVIIGATSASARFGVIGRADEIQLLIQGNSSQTNDAFKIVNSSSQQTFAHGGTGITQITARDSATTTRANTLGLLHSSSGTPAAGFGTNLLFYADSASVADRNQFTLASSWVDATDATRKAATIFYVYDTTFREVIRFQASGSAALIGFLGSAAVAKQTVTGSRGGNAALASLLTALATFGLITDSTSA